MREDNFGHKDSFKKNVGVEYRSATWSRYQFLRWGQQAFANFRVVPPGTRASATRSISNISPERCGRAKARTRRTRPSKITPSPDTLVGTDSHTTMVPNGLSVLGWGVGGIEAGSGDAGPADLDADPRSDRLPPDRQAALEGCTATDLVLTATQMLRKKGVVGKFVEYFGPGLDGLALAEDPRHHRQHGAGIRRDLWLLPHRWGDDPLSEGHRAQARARRAGREICQGARPLPHAQERRSGLHRHARTRHDDGRAQPRGPQPSAGSRRAQRCGGQVRRGAAQHLQEGRRRQPPRPAERLGEEHRPWRTW